MSGSAKRHNSRYRRSGRRLALHLLYAYELKHYQDDDALVVESDLAECGAEAQAFARELFDGFCRERPAVDQGVDERLRNWTLSRLAIVDRCVLRLGCYELLYCLDTPPKVVINEYIELARLYGSDARTTKLVNGVLDSIARAHRRIGQRPG